MIKKMMKALISAAVVFSIGLGTMTLTHAAGTNRDDISTDTKNLISKIINFYSEEYRPDIIKHLEDLKVENPEYHDLWKPIIDYWDWIERDMVENIDVAPDGIENPAKHAFIVLGFALNSNGTMTDELIGRLEVAKASALKYPESYILVTGGVEKNGWTEGRRMRDWLKEQGIAETRIIVEEKAPDTAGNATNSFKMLYEDYDVDSVSLITSQYHLKRGSILYYAESVLKANELGVEPITFLGEANAGWYRSDKTYESLSTKASSLRSIARVPNISIAGLNTIMQDLTINGKTDYIQGETLDITVTSVDSLNYHVDLTKFISIKGFDTNKIGESVLEISYTQGSSITKKDFTIHISQTPDTQITKERLGQLIAANEARDLNDYSRKSGVYFTDKLIEAKSILVNPNSTQEEIVEAYKRLNTAVQKLETLDNIARDKTVTANANQTNAYKITDGVLTTGSYWESKENNSNVAAKDTHFIIDLGGDFSIDTIKVFPYWGGNARYYQYEVYISKDQQDWELVDAQLTEDFITDKGNTHTLDKVTDARYIKVQGIKTFVTDRPDINNIHIIQVQAFGQKVDCDARTAIEELRALYDTNATKYVETNYTSETWLTYAKAIKEAEEILTYEIATKEEIDTIISTINTTASLLKYKDADYSLVDAAITKAGTYSKALYKNFTVVEEAIAVVVRDKNITEQEAVNKMAAAIQDALAKLEYKDADYSNVDAAIARAETLNKNQYKNFEAVEKAIGAVVRGKNITEQEVVDKMAIEIHNAIDTLEKKGSIPPITNENKGTTTTNTKAIKTGDASNEFLWHTMIVSSLLIFMCGVKFKKWES